MIHDKLKNIARYSQLFSDLVEYIENNNIEELPSGKTDISENIFALVNAYKTNSQDMDVLENHREYIDFQVMIAGREKVAFAFKAEGNVKEYDCEADYELVKANPVFLSFEEADFMVFYPGEYHRPGVSSEEDMQVKKIVFKIKL